MSPATTDTEASHETKQLLSQTSNKDAEDQVRLITDQNELLQLGIVSRIPIAFEEIPTSTWDRFTERVTTLTPDILAFEGDNEMPLYRNIMEMEDLPLRDILLHPNSPIGKAIQTYFALPSVQADVIQLDDAFGVHYNMDQADTTGAKHVDPSDITVNICLDKSDDCQGSHVLFHGIQTLPQKPQQQAPTVTSSSSSSTTTKTSVAIHTSNQNNEHTTHDTTSTTPSATDTKRTNKPSNVNRFRVLPEPGYAMLHWGHHPHETTRLECGHRTNVILTYCYNTETFQPSDVATRSCYNV